MTSKRPRLACLAGAGTAPELMAQASVALNAVAHFHGFELEQVHVPFGGLAYAHVAQLMPSSTRSALLGSDAVLVAGADEPALADVMAELDLRARVTRVRFGARDDVAFVTSVGESCEEWALERAFALAESRTLRLALVGDEAWRDAAEAIGADYEHVRVEQLSPRDAMPLAAFNASRFDVVAVGPSWAEAIVDIAAAPAESRFVAHALLAEHGPSLFVPSADGGFALAAGHGVVNPSSMLLAAALALQHGLGQPSAAATLAGAVSQALVDGPRTPDLLRRGIGVTTREFTQRVLAGFQLSTHNAEFFPGVA
ncbi:MAG TPA: isocitrate/isopropylmalate family dehydrogenase [Gaiellaceae bacterium]|nr:isocitrate/isopropylmalate family dehydrogenase [Gaiellaceae bacterium]